MAKCPVAAPKYAIGDRVEYKDRSKKDQIGEIRHIEATWLSNNKPLIVYRVSHPTYHAGSINLKESKIKGKKS